ncbi:transposase [Streptomyces sp. SID7803]|nr:transposase [Streptomyces sp. SID7803]
MHRVLLAELHAVGELDWSRACVGGSDTWAKESADTCPSPVNRQETGSKRHLICDGRCTPFKAITTAANVNDVTQTLARVAGISPVTGCPGRPRRRPDALLVDKGYDSNRLAPLRQVGSGGAQGGRDGQTPPCPPTDRTALHVTAPSSTSASNGTFTAGKPRTSPERGSRKFQDEGRLELCPEHMVLHVARQADCRLRLPLTLHVLSQIRCLTLHVRHGGVSTPVGQLADDCRDEARSACDRRYVQVSRRLCLPDGQADADHQNQDTHGRARQAQRGAATGLCETPTRSTRSAARQSDRRLLSVPQPCHVGGVKVLRPRRSGGGHLPR